MDKNNENIKGLRTLVQGYAGLLALAVLGVVSAALSDFTWQPEWFAWFSPVLAGLLAKLQNHWEDSK